MTCKQKSVTRMENMMPLIQETLNQGRSVRFYPMGTSMLPMLREGRDSVTLSPPPERLRKYDLPLYQRSSEKYVLHRVIKVGETYTMMGDNQFTPESGIRQEQIIGVVTAFSRGDREIPVTNLCYQIYCRIWHGVRPLRFFCRKGYRWLLRHLKKRKNYTFPTS